VGRGYKNRAPCSQALPPGPVRHEACDHDLRSSLERAGCPCPAVVYWSLDPPALTCPAGSRRPADPRPLDLARPATPS